MTNYEKITSMGIEEMAQVINDKTFGCVLSVGCRVELLQMDDVTAPPNGTLGTVMGVDDISSIMVAWDNGSDLSIAYGEDICRKI